MQPTTKTIHRSCLKCGSPQVRITSRGFSKKWAVAGGLAMHSASGLLLGLFGYDKQVLECQNCGYRIGLKKYLRIVENRGLTFQERLSKFALVFGSFTFANLLLWLIFRTLFFGMMSLTFGVAFVIVLIVRLCLVDEK